MAVPVQTWGSLGNMVAEQKAYGEATAEYLEQNEVYDLFQNLMRQLVIHQPENPIKFLQEQLSMRPQLVPLTVSITGPPGVNRSRYSKMLADELKLEYIHTGKLLKTREHEATIASGNLVEDKLVIPLVKDAIARLRGRGYVLDGFPRTRIQAQALSQRNFGFGLDNVLLLTAPESAIKEGFDAKIAAGQIPADREHVVHTKLQQYQRHVLGVAEVFKSVLRQIPAVVADDDKGTAVFENIKHCVHNRPFSNAPLRPQRICVTGPCASGRTTQCKELAKFYGLVHVDVAALIAKQQEDRGQVREEIPPEFISDEDLCAAVGQRLNEADCLRKGWVLDGFPKTRSQAEFLRQSHLWPSRVVELAIGLDVVQGRISTRRLDPETCVAYYREPTSVAIRQRLVQAAHDVHEVVASRYDMYSSNAPAVLDTFKGVSFSIRADDDQGSVMNNIVARIDEPIQQELAQEMEG
eukprot:TRINITY_DN10021_c1_g1_i1.p2 TRINITY_DN10021_c1_g1~~TRINITY_DN10021_c1_g1_i1.p2  ORF type:complete len:488 (-),score=127.63 TRINITY_DN10021_c1_g1_i1:97-1494(-)